MFHALSDEKPASNCIRLLQVEVQSSFFKKTIRVVSQVTVTLNCQVQLTPLPPSLPSFAFSFHFSASVLVLKNVHILSLTKSNKYSQF
ncbi:hypothetical protein NC652_040367 [Populus alba x Populus x berolinensis]|nr:hypothetical protein NC652_039899 [Populus alba x Populus x berolinensis]KAJ6863213.1 hypothetical protein NC652_039923 [Populus alba x Populus x berolinensis]KAJ6863799.1 hypothetical protein NC652_040367 [Populus alba x Populus x berolinensis]